MPLTPTKPDAVQIQYTPNAPGATPISMKQALDAAALTVNQNTFTKSQSVSWITLTSAPSLAIIVGPVISVVSQPSALLGDTGQGKVRAVCKSGSTTVESPESPFLIKLENTYGLLSLTHEFSVNPATGLPWQVAELDAAEFGVKGFLT